MSNAVAKWLMRRRRERLERHCRTQLLGPVLLPGLLAQQGGLGAAQGFGQLGALAAQTAQMNLNAQLGAQTLQNAKALQQQASGQALGLGQFGAAPQAAQRFPFLQREELPCPRCYQPMYHRPSIDVFGCNRCQLWVTRELALVSYIEEWGHWSDA